MPKATAINMLIDLTRYDSLQTKYLLLQGKTDDLQKIIDQKDGQLRDCTDSRDRLNLVITNYQALRQQDKSNVGAVEKLYRKEVRAGRFKLLLIGGLATVAAYAFLK